MLNFQKAIEIANASLQQGRERAFEPLTVAVLDAGGHVKVLLRSDGCSLLRPEIAVGKAWGVLGMGLGGRELTRRAALVPSFFTALNAMSGGRVIPVPGGVLVRSIEGTIIGSVGISGDSSENDEVCASEAIRQAGFIADAGAST